MVSERAGYRGRALSQPFVAPMWLIRKIGVRRNIAGQPPCIRKLRLPARFIVRPSETRHFCILHHMNNTKAVSLRVCLIDRPVDCCLRDQIEGAIDLRLAAGTGKAPGAFKLRYLEGFSS